MNWGQAPVKSGVPPSLDRKSSPWRVRYWGAAETADAPSLPQLLNPGNDAHYRISAYSIQSSFQRGISLAEIGS